MTIPAGTRALSGASLAAEERAKFATGAVEIAGQYPTTPLRSDSAIAVKFDQEIDPSALIPCLRVLSEKGKPLAFKSISLAEAERPYPHTLDPTADLLTSVPANAGLGQT